MMDLHLATDIGFIVVMVMIWAELRVFKEILKTRTGPVWHASIPKPYEPSKKAAACDTLKTSFQKKPMTYPKSEKQLAEREAVLQKNARDESGF